MSEQLLHLPLGLVSGLGQESFVIFWRDVVTEQTDCCQVQLPPLEQIEHDRKAACDARGRDPMKRLAIAQAQHLRAVLKK